MATENQLKALENWLGIPLADMKFKVASGYLDRLHQASEAFNEDKEGKKGIVKKVKAAITVELRKLGLVADEATATARATVAEEEEVRCHTLAGEKAATGGGEDTIGIEEELHRMVVVMRFAVREATAIVEQEINNGGIGEASKASILQKIATSLFIEAMRRGMGR